MTEYYNSVAEKLTSWGQVITPEDEILIKHLIKKVNAYARTVCNFSDDEPLPELVTPYFVDRVCSAYLYEKVKMGSIPVDDAIKTIKEGDISITYAFGAGTKTQEERFENLCSELNNQFRTVVMKYRKIAW